MIQDPAFALARHVAATRWEDLPPRTVAATRRDILDTLGCMLGGSAAPGIDTLSSVVGDWGGRSESRVLLRGFGLPAPQAALLNAAMGHALDFDDTLDSGGSIHPGVPVLAAALAAVDLCGGVAGRELMLAVALGLDISCRLALAATLDRGWHRTAAFGVFGAAAAAGKLLGLADEPMLNAFGIAYSHAAGNRQCILDGALTKRLQAGQAAAAGVFSAVLSQRGFTGARNVFDGRFGFFDLYQPDGCDKTRLLQDLGVAFRGDELSFKPHPCGRPLHAAIDAALAARAELAITGPGDIAAVTIETDRDRHALEFAAPEKRRPTQVVEAQFALPFLVAIALARGGVRIADVAGLGDAAVLALADRIEGVVGDDRGPRSLAVTVARGDGRRITVEAGAPSGSPTQPLSDARLEEKFRDCARNARLPLPPAVLDEALGLISGLETLGDARRLLALFAG